MTEARQAVHTAGLHGGISQQNPLVRSTKQVADLINLMPSPLHGGVVDRAALQLIATIPTTGVDLAGASCIFQTSDKSRWCLIRKPGGGYKIFNVATGSEGVISNEDAVLTYLGAGDAANIKFTPVGDTVFVTNPAVKVLATTATKPTRGAAYLVIRRVSTARQRFVVSPGKSIGTGLGNAIVQLQLNNTDSRETVAASMVTAINSKLGSYGLTASVMGNANYIVKIEGGYDALAQITATNDWDDAAYVLIKDRVTATSQLPPVFDEGVPIMVDLGSGDFKSAYYVRFDAALHAWIECSYANAGGDTCTLDKTTLPVQLTQEFGGAFKWVVPSWVNRSKGDNDSNPVPDFVGKYLTGCVNWSGRLVLMCEDFLYASQPDDLFNFWRETARESRPSDAFRLDANGPEVTKISHAIPSRSKLFISTNSVQLEVAGQSFTESDAQLVPVSHYHIENKCPPRVIGDSMYFVGPDQNGMVLWDYGYSNAGDANTAENTNEQCPRLIGETPDRVLGSASLGRIFLLGKDCRFIYTYAFHKSNGQRDYSAWTKLQLPIGSTVLNAEEYEGALYLLLYTGVSLVIATLKVLPDINKAAKLGNMRFDFLTLVSATWDAQKQEYMFDVPPHLQADAFRPYLAVLVDMQKGWGWWEERTVSRISQDKASFRGNIDGAVVAVGLRYLRKAVLGPFYPFDGQAYTPTGFIQCHKLLLDLGVVGDFTVMVNDKDRGQTNLVQWSPRNASESPATPVISESLTEPFPINGKGHETTVTITSTSSVPMSILGYTPVGRAINRNL